jgi:Lar family restriction alleviation protein
MSDDLKPCPFCGGNAKRYYRADDSGWENTYWVGCTDGCGASTACYETKALAVTVWNTRIDTDDMADRIEELEAKLAKEIEISNQRGNHIEFILTPQMSDLQFQLKDLQAQLAKAVDAIDGLLAVLPDDEGPEIDYARTTIAELKGEK